MDPSSLNPSVAYSSLLLVSGLLAALLAAAVHRRRCAAPGAGPLAFLMAGVSFWCLTYAIFWANPNASLAAFWLTITYVGVVTVPAAYFAFTLHLTARARWLTRPVIAVLLAEPLLTLLLMWTDRWHGLYYAGLQLRNTGMILHGGPVFYANVVYSQLLILAGSALLIHGWWRARGLYRWQLALVAAAGLIPLLASVVFILGLSPFPDADLTPLATSITGVFFAYALFKFSLLDVRPVARDTLIERMTDGVVVLDAQDRIVDYNPAALKWLGPEFLQIGLTPQGTLRGWLSYGERDQAASSSQLVLLDGSAYYLDVHVTPLRDQREERTGRLIVWRDVSELQRAQLELDHLAHSDALTGLPNRRAFDRDFDQAFEYAQWQNQTLGVLTLDLDGLKRLNDLEGHARGDELLQAFAQALTTALHGAGRVYRLGGDEYTALLPGIRLGERQDTLDRVLEAVRTVQAGGFEGVDVSAGLAVYPVDELRQSDLVRLSDERMYHAKRTRQLG